ncbi:type II toxin-antitoxin system VapC family toxin [Sorangium sp. So ce295]|uniref:type II toxin-antitoxin system VapC family toxin n=1 Tax=Sorangium sp. So ce295 TaxID=3133295 RepID=UPI003F62AF2A
MRVLLDTCALLWLVGAPARLSTSARTVLADAGTELFVSAISAFEIAVKQRKGKLALPLPARDWLRDALQAYAIRELPVTSEIAALAPEVAVSHADPCDRIIIATAQVHNIPVMTSDHLIAECAEINVLW